MNFKILDNESTREMFEGLIGNNYPMIGIDNNTGYIILDTEDGELLFELGEIELVKTN